MPSNFLFVFGGKGGKEMEYQLIRSRRRTLAMEIGPKGLVVRAPY